jgi:hypothetical protein
MKLRKTGDKRKFDFLEVACLGRKCFAPGSYQHRGATLSGSRNTGAYSDCCMNRAYRGCPCVPFTERELPEVSKELMAQRKREGWRKA